LISFFHIFRNIFIFRIISAIIPKTMVNQDFSNSLFQLASSFIHYTDRNLFLTGRAGTGKTTFLRGIMETTTKKAVVVAPTGVAAINAGGVTIHSFFQLPLGPFVPGRMNFRSMSSNPAYDKGFLLKHIRFNTNKRKLIEELEVLIIDEVSMVRADLLDAIDVVLKHFRNNHGTPFGGVQVLMIGDLFQLPPVTIQGEWDTLSDYYRSPFFFDALVLNQTPPLCIELQKIYRQSEHKFIGLLNRVRNNEVTDDDLEWLNTYYKPSFKPASEDNYITLTSHNHIADKINERELNSLSGKKHTFKASVEGLFNERSYPADEILQLKPGAQIMFIKNDKGEFRRYYNGKIGVIKDIDDETIVITFPNEVNDLELDREEWKNIRYTFNEDTKQIEEETLGSFLQFPVRLAWAVTIHKSQGLTFDKAIIDAGASFTAGQVYVALSRLTTMDGLVLRSKIGRESIQCDPNVIHFMNNLHIEDELKDMLKEDQKEYVHKNLTKSFDWNKIISAIQHIIEDYKEKKSPVSTEAIENGTLWLEKALDQKQVADKFIIELNKILSLKEAGYQRLQERVGAAYSYFTKRLKEELFDVIDHHRLSVSVKKQTKKYIKTLRNLQVTVKDLDKQLKSACMLAEGLNSGLDSLVIMQKLEDSKNEPVDLPIPEVKKAAKGETSKISLEMFREGKTVEDIANRRGLATTTVEGHFATFVKSGELSVFDFVAVDKVETILSHFKQSEILHLGPAKTALGDEFSYSDIKYVLGHYLWLQAQEENVDRR
jgi:hypothetical protein